MPDAATRPNPNSAPVIATAPACKNSRREGVPRRLSMRPPLSTYSLVPALSQPTIELALEFMFRLEDLLDNLSIRWIVLQRSGPTGARLQILAPHGLENKSRHPLHPPSLDCMTICCVGSRRR